MHSIPLIYCVLFASFHLAFSNPFTNIFGTIDSETPPFDVVSKGEKYEVRRYHSQVWAQTDYTVDPKTDFGDKLSIGFQKLFDYITGKNERKQKIPMTAPVVMQQLNEATGRRRMAFIMPASQFTTLDQLPKPSNADVTLVTVDQPLTFACIQFNMNINNKRIATREAELRAATNADSITLVNDRQSIHVNGYNPPWTLPWLRKNEICIPLANQA